MTELTLKLDKAANDSLVDLMSFYKIKTKAQVISKAIAVLKVVAHVNKTDGELFARLGSHETKIIVN